jgi:hypothetical protein
LLQVLCMTVEPGFGGQELIPAVLEKVRQLRAKFPGVDIQVDGGINARTAHQAALAGANIAVAGSAVFGAPQVSLNITSSEGDAICPLCQWGKQEHRPWGCCVAAITSERSNPSVHSCGVRVTSSLHLALQFRVMVCELMRMLRALQGLHSAIAALKSALHQGLPQKTTV